MWIPNFIRRRVVSLLIISLTDASVAHVHPFSPERIVEGESEGLTQFIVSFDGMGRIVRTVRVDPVYVDGQTQEQKWKM